MDKSPVEIMVEEILTELEQDKVQQFYEDVIMREAVRKILLRGLYQNGTLKAGVAPDPKQNFALAMANNPNATNESLGAELRGAYWGITILEQAFDKLSEIKKSAVVKKEEDNNIAE